MAARPAPVLAENTPGPAPRPDVAGPVVGVETVAVDDGAGGGRPGEAGDGVKVALAGHAAAKDANRPSPTVTPATHLAFEAAGRPGPSGLDVVVAGPPTVVGGVVVAPPVAYL